MSSLLRISLPAALIAAAMLLVMLPGKAYGQIPEPPSTFYGSVTDEEGEVEAGVKVEAIVNNKVCGETETVHAGDGPAQVTMYVIDVLSHRQVPGCGKPGDAVRLRVGDRLAEESVAWGGVGELVLFNVVFGEVTPDVIPTTTPTPTFTATVAAPAGTSPTTEGSPVASVSASVANDGSPGAGSTQPGGVVSTTPAGVDAIGDDDGGGFPMWALLLLVVGGIAAIGGGIGFAMSRSGAPAGPLDEPGTGEAAPRDS